MTRNRDQMSLADMIRVCALSSVAIVALMMLLGTLMIWQKPEARLELASTAQIMQLPAEAAPAGTPVRMATAGAAATPEVGVPSL